MQRGITLNFRCLKHKTLFSVDANELEVSVFEIPICDTHTSNDDYAINKIGVH